jgi:hypothetical protein
VESILDLNNTIKGRTNAFLESESRWHLLFVRGAGIVSVYATRETLYGGEGTKARPTQITNSKCFIYNCDPKIS